MKEGPTVAEASLIDNAIRIVEFHFVNNHLVWLFFSYMNKTCKTIQSNGISCDVTEIQWKLVNTVTYLNSVQDIIFLKKT